MTSNLTRTVVALACTIVMSATCLIGAVAPAAAGTDVAVAAARQVA